MGSNYVTGLGNWIVSCFVKRSHDFIETAHGTRCLISPRITERKNKNITVQNAIAVLHCITNNPLIFNLFDCFQNTQLADVDWQVSVFRRTQCKAEERWMPPHTQICTHSDQQYSVRQNITKVRKLKCQVVEGLVSYSCNSKRGSSEHLGSELFTQVAASHFLLIFFLFLYLKTRSFRYIYQHLDIWVRPQFKIT